MVEHRVGDWWGMQQDFWWGRRMLQAHRHELRTYIKVQTSLLLLKRRDSMRLFVAMEIESQAVGYYQCLHTYP